MLSDHVSKKSDQVGAKCDHVCTKSNHVCTESNHVCTKRDHVCPKSDQRPYRAGRPLQAGPLDMEHVPEEAGTLGTETSLIY